jgi:formiminotetrahydrofolate cyclodeaminase
MTQGNEIGGTVEITNNKLHLDMLSINDFSDDLGSSSPAPGGGSVAALSGVLAASLVLMVSKISLKHTSSDYERIKLEEIISKDERCKNQLLQLINDDTLAFNKITNNYKLPKSTEVEKQVRRDAIQSATKHAAKVPLKTARLGMEILEIVDDLTQLGYDQTISDIGVAGLMSYSAIIGAIWNVNINLNSIKDTEFVNQLKPEIDEILKQTDSHWTKIKNNVDDKI